jgi:hypothetical protein
MRWFVPGYDGDLIRGSYRFWSNAVEREHHSVAYLVRRDQPSDFIVIHPVGQDLSGLVAASPERAVPGHMADDR